MNIIRHFNKVTIELTFDEAVEFNSNLNGVLDTLSDVGNYDGDQLETVAEGLDNILNEVF